MLGILGLGAFGTALAIAAANNNPKVLLWGISKQVEQVKLAGVNKEFLPDLALSDNVTVTDDLALVINQCRDLLIAVPSSSFKDLLIKLKPLLKDNSRLIWITKGLEPKTGRFLHQVVEEIVGANYSYGLMSGPSFAIEVAKKLPTAIAVACNNEELSKDVVKYFQQDWLKIYINNDLLGVELGGAIKNIYAVATGMAEGLGFEANGKAALITKSLAEINKLAVAIGVKRNTVMSLACCGDLILTCSDNKSRNRRFGVNIGKGMNITEAEAAIGGVVEAKYNSIEICKLAAEHKVKMPIAIAINNVLQGKLLAEDIAGELL